MTRNSNDVIEQYSKFTSCINLESESDALIVVTPGLGARVLVVSPTGKSGENLLWTNPALSDTAVDWNFGGARTWIAPEDKFYLDRQNNWFVPAQMDPGHYEITAHTSNQIECANEFTIRNQEQVEYHVKIIRNIKTLKALNNLPNSVKFAGFEFTHSIQNLGHLTWGKQVDFMGLWSLIQINPGGTLLVPIKTETPTPYRNYFNIFTDSYLRETGPLLSIKIDGKFRGKLGIAPTAAGKWLCYVCDRGPSSYLIIKEFAVDPSGTYLDHPWGKATEYGDPVQLYNDDGQMGGFGEMECHAPAQVLKSQAQQTYSAKVTFLAGPLNVLQEFTEQQFKIRFNSANIF